MSVLKFNNYIRNIYLCESFQSGLLRNIINKHGKPKHSWDNKILHDLKDDEIIDVVPNKDDYYKKYFGKEDSKQKTFCVELMDGSCLVIGNLGLFKGFFDQYDDNDMRDLENEFDSRIRKRHVGKQSNTGDDIHRKHMENVNKIVHRRNVEKIREMMTNEDLSNIVDIINDKIDEMSSNLESGEHQYEEEITFCGMEGYIYIDLTCSIYEGREKYGAIWGDVYIYVTNIDVCVDSDEMYDNFNAEDLGIDLNKFDYKESDVELEITDYYDYYGVSRSDFV